ncbi:hypothetical protein EZV62_016826 [Acer yangbiense]|uniref:cyclin-dependent kinase n=1 Tax=Acer yangbiense TaxID=1000413 RepID=A0A5C7HPJ2_9ROSI|nr:hypothetical protein EZV62_016826 [Acer yangbiense]
MRSWSSRVVCRGRWMIACFVDTGFLLRFLTLLLEMTSWKRIVIESGIDSNNGGSTGGGRLVISQGGSASAGASSQVHFWVRLTHLDILPTQMAAPLEQYRKISFIGLGTNSELFEYRHLASQQRVAVKKIRKQVHATFNRTREMYTLQGLNHVNVIRWRELQETDTHWYLVLEYVATNLKTYMSSIPNFANDQNRIRSFLFDVLRGLAHCHAQGVIHRDLKLQSLLVDTENNRIKIAGFAQSRMFPSFSGEYTPKVGTLRYKAPEILFDSKMYSTSVDIWSVGCIFAEMLLSKQLFRGDDVQEQLLAIFSIVGSPNENSWPGFNAMPNFETTVYMSRPQNWTQVIPNLEEDGINLISEYNSEADAEANRGVNLREDELGQQECMKFADTRIKTMLRRLKMQLLKGLSFLDAIFLRDGEEKSEAAAKELLADEAHEAETKKNTKELKENKHTEDDFLWAIVAAHRQPLIPHLEYEYPDIRIHKDLYKLVQYSCEEMCSTKEPVNKAMKLWTTFMEPILGVPPHPDCMEDAEDVGKRRHAAINNSASSVVESDGSPEADCTAGNSRQRKTSGSGNENTSAELNNLCRTALANGNTVAKESFQDLDLVGRDDLTCSTHQLEKEQKDADAADKRSGNSIQVASGERVANSIASRAIGAENRHGRTGTEATSGP